MAVHQVQLGKADGGAQIGVDAHFLGRGVLRLHDVGGAHLMGDRADHIARINPAPGGFQHVGIDVGRQNAILEPRVVGGIGIQHHRQRIGLCPCRTGGAPRPDRQVGPRGKFGQDLLRQTVEMQWFAKEIGLVGGQRIDQMRQFTGDFPLGEHISAIIIQPQIAQRPRPPPQPPLDHGAFGRGQLDPAVIADQPRQPFEIVGAECVFGDIGQGHSGVGVHGVDPAMYGLTLRRPAAWPPILRAHWPNPAFARQLLRSA